MLNNRIILFVVILMITMITISCEQSSIVDQNKEENIASSLDPIITGSGNFALDVSSTDAHSDEYEFNICREDFVKEFNMIISGQGNPSTTGWYISESHIIDFENTDYDEVGEDILVPSSGDYEGNDFFLTAEAYDDPNSPQRRGNLIQLVNCSADGGNGGNPECEIGEEPPCYDDGFGTN